MLVRTLLVAATAAVLVPLAGGTAHASCLDDAQANIDNGYTGDNPKSRYWNEGYVQYTGTATVAVQGDALIADQLANADDWVRYTEAVSENADNVTLTFVDCVAG